MKRKRSFAVDTRATRSSRFSMVGCLIRRLFGNRASPTLCKSVTSVANAGKTLHLAKLGSSLRGLCIGQECLGPRSKRLGMANYVFGQTWAQRVGHELGPDVDRQLEKDS